jgi:uncharacterized DUF497 family protein
MLISCSQPSRLSRQLRTTALESDASWHARHPWKAEANAAKCGVSFDEAVTVFLSRRKCSGRPSSAAFESEMRYLRLAQAADRRRVLIVAYTFEAAGAVRES